MSEEKAIERSRVVRLRLILIVALLVGLILMIPVDTIESFESTQVPMQKEYQVPIQKEKTEVVISQTFQLWKEEVSPSLYTYERWIKWRPRYQNEWVTGSFTANDTLMDFSIMDSKNFDDLVNKGECHLIYSQYCIISDNFTFKPQAIDDYYFYFHDPFGVKIISFKLTSHWYETEYKTSSPTPMPTPTLIPDSDGDGWTDDQERRAGTDPYKRDTDNDGYWDPQDPNPLDPTIPMPLPTVTPMRPTPTPVSPGFEAMFAIAGLLTATYLFRRRKRNKREM